MSILRETGTTVKAEGATIPSAEPLGKQNLSRPENSVSTKINGQDYDLQNSDEEQLLPCQISLLSPGALNFTE